MANVDVLREFLVNVRGNVDQASFKKLDATLAGVTKGVGLLTAAFASSAIAVVTYVAKVSEQLADLHFASERLRSSVGEVQGYELSIQSLGGTAQEARSSLETLARQMRTNPGAVAFLRNLGVDPNASTPQIMQQLSRVLGNVARQQGYIFAAKYGELLGLDESTIFRLVNHPEAFKDKFSQLYKAVGLDADAAARAGAEFRNVLLQTSAQVKVLGQAIAIDLMPYAQTFLSWAQAAISWVTNFLGSMHAGKNVLGEWGPPLAELVSGLKDLAGMLLGVGKKLSDAFGPGVRDTLHFVLDVLNGIVDLLTGKWGKAWDNAKKAALDAMKGIVNLTAGLVDLISGGEVRKRNNGSVDVTQFQRPTVGTEGAANSNQPGGVRRNNPGNLRQWGNAPQQGGFATFGTAEQGISAMTRQLQLYAERGMDTVRAIISKWAPSNENNTGAYIQDVARKLGVDPDKHMNLADQKTMEALVAAIIRHENGQMPYSAAQMSSAVGSRFSSGTQNVTLQQKTDVHVVGSADAAATGRAVVMELDRVNGDAVRNLKGAVR